MLFCICVCGVEMADIFIWLMCAVRNAQNLSSRTCVDYCVRLLSFHFQSILLNLHFRCRDFIVSSFQVCYLQPILHIPLNQCIYTWLEIIETDGLWWEWFVISASSYITHTLRFIHLDSKLDGDTNEESILIKFNVWITMLAAISNLWYISEKPKPKWYYDLVGSHIIFYVDIWIVVVSRGPSYCSR